MNDPKQPLTNPALKQAISAMKKDNTPQTRNVMINEMMRSTFLVPVQVGFAGTPPKTGQKRQDRRTAQYQNFVCAAWYHRQKTIFHGFYRLGRTPQMA